MYMQHRQGIKTLVHQESVPFQAIQIQNNNRINRISSSTSTGINQHFSDSWMPSVDVGRINIRKNQIYFEQNNKQLKSNTASTGQLCRGMMFQSPTNQKKNFGGPYQQKNPNNLYLSYKNIPHFEQFAAKQEEKNRIQRSRKAEFTNHQAEKIIPQNQVSWNSLEQSLQTDNVINRQFLQEKKVQKQQSNKELKIQIKFQEEEINKLKKNMMNMKQKDDKKWHQVGIFASELKRKADDKSQKYDELEIIYINTERKYQQIEKKYYQIENKYKKMEEIYQSTEIILKEKNQKCNEIQMKLEQINLELKRKLIDQDFMNNRYKLKEIQLEGQKQEIQILKIQLGRKQKRIAQQQCQKKQKQIKISQFQQIIKNKNSILKQYQNEMLIIQDVKKKSEQQLQKYKNQLIQCKTQLIQCQMKITKFNKSIIQKKQVNQDKIQKKNLLDKSQIRNSENSMIKKQFKKDQKSCQTDIEKINFENIVKQKQQKQKQIQLLQNNKNQCNQCKKYNQLVHLLDLKIDQNDKQQLHKKIIKKLQNKKLDLISNNNNKEVQLTMHAHEMQKQLKWCNKKLNDLRIKLNQKNCILNECNQMIISTGLSIINNSYQQNKAIQG